MKRRLRFALARFGVSIKKVTVRLTDLSVSKGTIDKECLIVVSLRREGEVVVRGRGEYCNQTFNCCADRIGRAVERELSRDWKTPAPEVNRIQEADLNGEFINRLLDKKKEDAMGREKLLFKSEEKKNSVEIVAFLRNIADKIEQDGSMTLLQGEDRVVLDFPNSMTMEIKVEDEEKKRKGTKRTFEIELEWYPDSDYKQSSVVIE